MNFKNYFLFVQFNGLLYLFRHELVGLNKNVENNEIRGFAQKDKDLHSSIGEPGTFQACDLIFSINLTKIVATRLNLPEDNTIVTDISIDEYTKIHSFTRLIFS